LVANEIAFNFQDNKLFTRNPTTGNIVSVTLGGGGGGGSASIVEATTVAGFPATGSAGTIYHATNARRLYFWDSSGVYVEAGTSGGGGSSSAAISWSSVPSSATATGTAGQIAYDGSYFYLASATNTWVRAAVSTWVPFAPTAITGLQLWLDASDASTLYDATTGGSLVSANGAVARWEDKSGNSRHATQSTSGYRPLRKTAQQNGLAALEFSASSNQRIAVSGSAASLNFLHASAYTIFCVVRAGLAASPNMLNPIVSTISTFSGLPGMAIYHDDRSSIPRSSRIGHSVLNSSDGILGWTSADNFFPANAFGVLTMTGDMTSATASVRATAYNTAGVSASAPSTSGSASVASSQSDFTIGALSEQFWLTGQVAEIVVYNSALSSTDRNSVCAYLTSKWAVS